MHNRMLLLSASGKPVGKWQLMEVENIIQMGSPESKNMEHLNYTGKGIL